MLYVHVCMLVPLCAGVEDKCFSSGSGKYAAVALVEKAVVVAVAAVVH